MKITGVTPFTVATPPPHRGGLEWYFLRMETDEGIVGWDDGFLIPSRRPGLGVELREDALKRHAVT